MPINSTTEQQQISRALAILADPRSDYICNIKHVVTLVYSTTVFTYNNFSHNYHCVLHDYETQYGFNTNVDDSEFASVDYVLDNHTNVLLSIFVQVVASHANDNEYEFDAYANISIGIDIESYGYNFKCNDQRIDDPIDHNESHHDVLFECNYHQ